MKVFSTSQIKKLDQYTIEHEPIGSVELMERAAEALCDELITMFPDSSSGFCIFAGPGNNGGDALAVARKLYEHGYPVAAHLYHTGKISADCNENKRRLEYPEPAILTEYIDEFTFPRVADDAVVIDALFGSGLSRGLSGAYAELVHAINQLPNTVVAVDIPSGMNGDDFIPASSAVVMADYTLSLQFPKIAFFFPENAPYLGHWSVLGIGIHPDGIEMEPASYYYQEVDELTELLHRRSLFSHKGTFGHLALLAGCKGMAGASVLAAKAALRTGVGLLTVHGPEANRTIVQTAVPEAIFDADSSLDYLSEFPDPEKYKTLAVGPGIGTRRETVDMLTELLPRLTTPCVIDADALNIVGVHRNLLDSIPGGSIITPHPGEFDRLCDQCVNSRERMEKALMIAAKYGIYVVMKGAYTKIITPEGNVFFNSTGNPGMSTAGSGDVLTGMIGALLAQGYEPEESARLGVFLHGLAADIALEEQSVESLLAGDIIAHLGKAFKRLKQTDYSL